MDDAHVRRGRSVVGNRLSFGTAVSLMVLWPLTAVTAGSQIHGAVGLLALFVTVAHVVLHWKALRRLAKTSFRTPT